MFSPLVLIHTLTVTTVIISTAKATDTMMHLRCGKSENIKNNKSDYEQLSFSGNSNKVTKLSYFINKSLLFTG